MKGIVSGCALERIRAALFEKWVAATIEHIVAETADEHLIGGGAGQGVVARRPKVGHRAGDIAAIDYVRAVAADQHVGETVAIDVGGTDIVTGSVVRGCAKDGEPLVFPDRSDIDVAVSAFLAEDDIGLAGSIPVRHGKPRP